MVSIISMSVYWHRVVKNGAATCRSRGIHIRTAVCRESLVFDRARLHELVVQL